MTAGIDTDVVRPPMTAPGRPHDRRLTITLTDDIDCAAAPALEQRVHDIIAIHSARHVTIDLAAVDFCDTAGVRTLAALHRAVTHEGGTCRIRGPRPHIAWLIQTLGGADLIEGRPGTE